MTEPACPRCKAKQSSRVKRQGLLQSIVFPKLGLFPWECGGCRNIFMARTRGKLKRRRREDGEPFVPHIPS